MKKIIYLLSIGLLSYQCTIEPSEPPDDYFDSNNVESQTPQARSMERIDDSLFVVEYGKRYSVDPNVITVKYKPELRKPSQKISELRSNRLGYIDIRVPERVDVEEYVLELEKSGEFASVEYNTYGEWCYSPNDARVNEQWYLNTINAYRAWDITAGTSSVKVAIIDSGVDVNHPDLGAGTDGYGNVDASLGWNFITNSSDVSTTNGHGTRVAGIVAAKTDNNGRGMAGVAGGKGNRGITMIPYCIGIGSPNASVIDDAIYDAVGKGARVIQLSLAVGTSSAITSAINYATQNNVVVVCASGNGYASTVSYPASLDNVIAVGATAQSNVRADFSNYGTALDVVAPGVDILSTILNGGYGSSSGTSFAAPQISGIAALLLSIKPDLTSAQVANIIKQSACKVNRNNPYTYSYHSSHPGGTWNDQMGHGLVDARGAIDFMLNISGPETLLIGSSATYSIAYPPAGFTWEASSNLSLSGSGNSVTVTGIDNGFGSIRILINGTEVVRKSVEVVPPTYRTSLRITNLCDGSNTFEALIVAGEADDYPNSNELVYANNNLTVPYTPYTYQYQYVELDDGTSPDEPGVYLPEGQYTLLLYHQSVSTRYYYYVFTVPFEGYLLVEKEGADYWYDWYEPE